MRHLAGVPVRRSPPSRDRAWGLGMQLAVACDVRVVADSARFAVPVAKLGLWSDRWTIDGATTLESRRLVLSPRRPRCRVPGSASSGHREGQGRYAAAFQLAWATPASRKGRRLPFQRHPQFRRGVVARTFGQGHDHDQLPRPTTARAGRSPTPASAAPESTMPPPGPAWAEVSAACEEGAAEVTSAFTWLAPGTPGAAPWPRLPGATPVCRLAGGRVVGFVAMGEPRPRQRCTDDRRGHRLGVPQPVGGRNSRLPAAQRRRRPLTTAGAERCRSESLVDDRADPRLPHGCGLRARQRVSRPGRLSRRRGASREVRLSCTLSA